MATIILKNLYHNGEQVKEIIQNGDIIYVGAQKLVFDVDKDSISFEDTGGSTTITITANDKWTMTKPEWITASQTSGTSAATITLSASATETERTGNIVIACGGKTKTISIVQAQDYSKTYLTIEALSGGTFYVRKANIDYSVNGAAWETTTGETALALNQGDAVRYKGSINSSTQIRGLFSGNTLATVVYGNPLSLQFPNFPDQKNITFQMKEMFLNNTGLADASHLDFSGIMLADYSLQNTFYGCTHLVKAPTLPFSHIPGNDSCDGLFKGCTSLNFIRCLATNINYGGTDNWVQGVSPTGTFVKKAGVTWPTGDSGIPSGWTVIEE